MTPYPNASGRSGVRATGAVQDGIRVQFSDGSIYTYTYESAGPDAVKTMHDLAKAGRGLNAWINRNRPGYASKS